MKKITRVLYIILVVILNSVFIMGCNLKALEDSSTMGHNEEGIQIEASESLEPVVLEVVTMMGGTDANTEKFHEVIKEFEQQYPHVSIEDSSQAADQDWKVQIAADFAVNNEPDVIQYFTDYNASDVLATNKFVPLAEIQQVYPEYAKNTLQSALEGTKSPLDGVNYAVPTAGYWEGLFCNKDLFDQYNLELPRDWSKFKKAIHTFQINGIIPISVSLNDIPNYWIDFLMMSGTTPEEFEQIPASAPDGWVKGLSLLKELRDLGAFPSDTDTIDNDMASNLFKQKKAAMQLDGSWYLASILDQDNTVVVPFPTIPGGMASKGTAITGYSSGFYITKRAWEDPNKREAAVNFVLANTNDAQIIKYWNGNGTCSVPVSDNIVALTPLQISGREYAESIEVPLSATDSRISQEAFTILKDGIISISTGESSAEDIINGMLRVHNRQ